jgi:hypothetical protein
MRTPEEPRTPQTPAPPWTPCAPLAFGLSKALLRGSPGSGTRDARTTTPADHRRRELAKITNLSQNLKYLAASSAACLPRAFIEYSQSSAAIYFFYHFPNPFILILTKRNTHTPICCAIGTHFRARIVGMRIVTLLTIARVPAQARFLGALSERR